MRKSFLIGDHALICDSFLAIITCMTSAARLLLSARRAAGLTQRALARRARTSQSVIARIESGTTSPSWKTLEHLLKHAGFELQASFTIRARGHSHMLDDVPRILRLTPEERLLELRNAARFFAAAKRLDDGRI
jgi:transcriptional regulator with XRE-family HTH domain